MKKPIVRTQPSYDPNLIPGPPMASEGYQPQPKRKGYLKWLFLFPAAVVLVGAVMVSPSYWLQKLAASYTPEYLPVVEVRHEVIGEAKNEKIPTAESLITPAMKKELFEGKGLEVNLISLYKGKDDEQAKFIIEPWKTYEETSPAQRQKLVGDKIVELQKKLDLWNGYSPRDWNFLVLVDDTEGVTPDLKKKFQIVYDDLLIDERVRHGDAVTVHFAKLSFTEYSQERKVSLPRGSMLISGSAQSELNSAIQWVQQPKSESNKSSVYKGLLNLLSEYAKVPRTRVVILSDMMENDPDGTGVSFYRGDGKALLFAKDQWETLDNKLLAGSDPPNLSGLAVKIYAPPSVMKIPKVAKEAQKYAEHLLRKLGAEVETKY